jgi:hypothetical protein
MKVHPADAGLVIRNRDMEANAVAFAFLAALTLARSRATKSLQEP